MILACSIVCYRLARVHVLCSKLGNDTLYASTDRSSERLKQYRDEYKSTSGHRWAFYGNIYKALASITTHDGSALSFAFLPLSRPARFR
jgi:hypothetical protein